MEYNYLLLTFFALGESVALSPLFLRVDDSLSLLEDAVLCSLDFGFTSILLARMKNFCCKSLDEWEREGGRERKRYMCLSAQFQLLHKHACMFMMYHAHEHACISQAQTHTIFRIKLLYLYLPT